MQNTACIGNDVVVMAEHADAIGAQLDVDLAVLSLELGGQAQSGLRIVGSIGAGTTMGDGKWKLRRFQARQSELRQSFVPRNQMHTPSSANSSTWFMSIPQSTWLPSSAMAAADWVDLRMLPFGSSMS